MTKFLSSFLGGWSTYLIAGFVAISFGFYLGWTVEGWRASADIAAIDKEFADYKSSVSQDAARVSEETVSKLLMAQQRNNQLSTQLHQLEEKSTTDSATISESLKNVPSDQQSPLSKFVLDYLSELHDKQTRHP